MENIDFIWLKSEEEAFKDARMVRRTVFCDEQGYSLIGEFDETDKLALHVVGYAEKKPVCTARFFEEANGVYHIGRVAVLAELRGKGVGLEIMRCLSEKAQEINAKKLILNAQADKYAFYEKAGFKLTGKKLLDEGQPHVEMEMEIKG